MIWWHPWIGKVSKKGRQRDFSPLPQSIPQPSMAHSIFGMNPTRLAAVATTSREITDDLEALDRSRQHVHWDEPPPPYSSGTSIAPLFGSLALRPLNPTGTRWTNFITDHWTTKSSTSSETVVHSICLCPLDIAMKHIKSSAGFRERLGN